LQLEDSLSIFFI